ncbi:hypothetical protein TNCT_722071 [Trichonephila clavata]|uniref:Uncharacterized protein n=1 Tax=Trichonephila clavata TaxID=2740835 RepID=A0A8X6GAX1_TRICU|nr:hypothetical protein TNCT_722071 [Trichonephila clavata]
MMIRSCMGMQERLYARQSVERRGQLLSRASARLQSHSLDRWKRRQARLADLKQKGHDISTRSAPSFYRNKKWKRKKLTADDKKDNTVFKIHPCALAAMDKSFKNAYFF